MRTLRNRTPKYVLVGILSIIGMSLFFLAGCMPQKNGYQSGMASGPGQPSVVDPSDLKPGISVRYLYGFWRHINEMPDAEQFAKKGKPGEPILFINHRFGNKRVFGSGKSRGVGVLMEGFIHLDLPGVWEFKVRSNDGIRMVIGQTLVADDPDQHSDRFSQPMGFTAGKPGYFPLMIQYFQRKGTATLECYWKRPGETDFVIIPEKAYRHIPE